MSSTPLNCFQQDDVTPKVGTWIVPDGWQGTMIGGNLVEANDWDRANGAPFRIETGHDLIPTLPVNIRITGRVATWWGQCSLRTRVEIEFIGDCEPSTFCRGWMVLNNHW